jgi:hypothetical protein
LSGLHGHPEPGTAIRITTAAIGVGFLKGHFSESAHVAEALKPGQASVVTHLLLAKTLDGFAKLRVANRHVPPHPTKATAQRA